LDKFESTVQRDGLIIVNSSLIDRRLTREDVKTIYIPLTDITTEMGVPAAQSVAAIAAYLHYTKIIPVETLGAILQKTLKRKELVEKNLLIFEKIVEYVDNI
ncbi:MAG: 2-oxoacid:acceptor oxidoreductase family protein, partial [Oligoflexia bacterium]|nr:2-oxoacid:acceptor oxidoreductase family protein [Oligoflexia bacterium]